jgi:acetoin utilization deacetylase AcuC-like enzyme
VGGVDPFEQDQLGSLRLSKEGIKTRDATVFGYCHGQGVPVAAVLAGGYAVDLRDTVDMHVNTYLTLRDVFEGGPGRAG